MKIFYYLAWLIPAVLSRTIILIESKTTSGTYEIFLGIFSELSISFLLGSFFCLSSSKIFKLLLGIVYLAYVTALFANLQMIEAVSSPLSFALLYYLTDPTFISGSILDSKIIFNHSWIIIFLSLVLYFSKKPKLKVRTFIFAVLCSCGFLFLPRSSLEKPWINLGVFHYNLMLGVDSAFSTYLPLVRPYKKMIKNSSVLSKYKNSDVVRDEFKALVSSRSKKNIILIMVEGLNGGYFKNIRKDRFKKTPVEMAKTDRQLENAVWFRSFLAPNEQTHRGGFSFLCGAYPNMANYESKTESFIFEEDQRFKCLPSYLNDRGYHTVYMQANDLTFMKQRRFLDIIGFHKTIGVERFTKSERVNGWGPDDEYFFQEAFDEIKKLDHQEKPFFITLLTTGTHHPYTNIPKDFMPSRSRGHEDLAYKFADYALSNLIEKLKKEKILENTLIFLTSDEAHSLGNSSHINNILSKNLIPFAIYGSNLSFGLIDTVYLQNDFMASILDLVDGLEENNKFNYHRSFFRRTKKTSDFFLAAVRSNRILNYDFSNKKITLCKSSGQSCFEYKVKFNDDYFVEKILATKKIEQSQKILSFISGNEKIHRVGELKNINLGKLGPVGVMDSGVELKLVGDQWFEVPKESLLEVEHLIEVSEAVTLRYLLFSHKNGGYLFRPKPIQVSKGVHRIRFSYYFSNFSEGVVAALLITPHGDKVEASLLRSQAKIIADQLHLKNGLINNKVTQLSDFLVSFIQNIRKDFF